MNFIKRLFRKKELGTGEGQIFKDGIKALAFEVYRHVSVLHIEQLNEGKVIYKYLYYTSDGDVDRMNFGVAKDLDDSKKKAYAEIDKL